jgi:hypothetical protein
VQKFLEILKLKTMLEESKIPFVFKELFNGYQIMLNDEVDAIEHDGSYGWQKDLIEIMGGLTEEENEHDSVLGYLSAEEVFKRFKYCYENKTSVYKEQMKENEVKELTCIIYYDEETKDYIKNKMQIIVDELAKMYQGRNCIVSSFEKIVDELERESK